MASLPHDLTTNGMDQGSLVTYLENVRDVVNELQTDHATYKTVVDEIKSVLNQLRNLHLYSPLGDPAFVIDTNFDVKNGTAIAYLNGGTLKALSANTSFDTGTSKTLTGAKWGAALLSVNASGTAVVTWAASEFASEALAIAALTLPDATSTVLGYVTVLAHASGFTAGTDALQGGTGGNVATTTTYYNAVNPNSLLLATAVANSSPASLTNSTALTLSGG